MGTQKLILMEKLWSLSEILFRPDVGSLSQEGQEDSGYGDEMELGETTVSGHESRENDQGVFRDTFAFGCNDRTRRDVTISQIRMFGLRSRARTGLSQYCPHLSSKLEGQERTPENVPVLAVPQPNTP
jgi:hypothetical protein